MSEVSVSKWGNSGAIRLPKAIMDGLGLKYGEKVSLDLRDGEAVFKKVKTLMLAPTIEELVAEMNRLGWENEPESVNWGPDVGSERFYDHD